jgi:hypothetical protein
VIKEVVRLASPTPLLNHYDEEPDEVVGYHWPANTHFVVAYFFLKHGNKVQCMT